MTAVTAIRHMFWALPELRGVAVNYGGKSVSMMTHLLEGKVMECFVKQTAPHTMAGVIHDGTTEGTTTEGTTTEGTTTETSFTAEATLLDGKLCLSHTAPEYHRFVAPTATACSKMAEVASGRVRRVVIKHVRGQDQAVLKVYTNDGTVNADAYFDAHWAYMGRAR